MANQVESTEEICVRCESGCQRLCQTNQNVSEVITLPSWNCVDSEEIIGHGESSYWSRKDWIALMQYIDDARYNKSKKTYITSWRFIEDSSFPNEQFLTAESFNAVAKALNKGGVLPEKSADGSGSIHVEKDDLIYGSYLQQLINEAETLMFNPLQCNIYDDAEAVTKTITHYCGDCCDCKEKSDKK